MRTRTSAPIPPALRTVGLFVNTWDIEAGIDRLETPIELSHWAAERQLTPTDARFTHADLQRARTVREGIRALLSMNNGQQGAGDPAAIAALDQIAATVPLRAAFSSGAPAGWRPVGRRPIDRVLGALLTTVQTAVIDGSWPRLKACREHGCRWAFYDSSKNKSGTWCSMTVCGNAAKQRAYVSRRRAARTAKP